MPFSVSMYPWYQPKLGLSPLITGIWTHPNSTQASSAVVKPGRSTLVQKFWEQKETDSTWPLCDVDRWMVPEEQWTVVREKKYEEIWDRYSNSQLRSHKQVVSHQLNSKQKLHYFHRGDISIWRPSCFSCLFRAGTSPSSKLKGPKIGHKNKPRIRACMGLKAGKLRELLFKIKAR